jgi:hypothetical protein
MTQAQTVLVATLRQSLPGLRALAVKLNVPGGDSLRELETVRLNKALHHCWQLFPGSEFWSQAAGAGFAIPGTSYEQEKSWKASYTKEDAVKLRDWIKAILDSGKWNGGDKPADLTDAYRGALNKALTAADTLVDSFNAPPKAPKSASFHGIAAPAAVAAFAAAPWLAAVAVALLGIWLVLRYAFREERPSAGEEYDSPARRTRVEIASRRLADAGSTGIFESRRIGSGGSEYAETREYSDEEPRDIDWHASDKAGSLQVRKYAIDRDMPIFVVKDVSRSGAFGTRGRTKQEAIDDVADALALGAARANHPIGGMTFGGAIEAEFTPRSGVRAAAAMLDEMRAASPSKPGTALREALSRAGGVAGGQGIIFIVSDFMAPDFTAELRELAARFDVRPIRVFDPAEGGPLPDVGLLPAEDAETGTLRMVDTTSKANQAETAAAIKSRERRIAKAFDDAGVDPIMISTQGDALDALTAALDRNARRRAGPETSK